MADSGGAGVLTTGRRPIRVSNVAVVRYESAEGRRLHSELLLADAAHTRSDVLTSCTVLVSLAATWLGFPILDAVGALVIAVFIARTGYLIGFETSGILADRVVLDEHAIRGWSWGFRRSSDAITSARAAPTTIRSWISTSGSRLTPPCSKPTGSPTSSRTA